jgi:hypothetical protein
MAITLYDATAKRFLITLGALKSVFEKGLDYCRDNNLDTNDLVAARICADMHPLSYQARAVRQHSAGAVAGAKAGMFTPPPAMELPDYAALQNQIDLGIAELEKTTPDEINALEGKNVVFKYGEFEIPFVAEEFLLSFSLPNFYFHATTAYDLLRGKGVPIGKRDFMGALPVRR